jgi:hypothetical protein
MAAPLRIDCGGSFIGGLLERVDSRWRRCIGLVAIRPIGRSSRKTHSRNARRPDPSEYTC